MLLEKDERGCLTQLFEHLSAVDSADFTKDHVQNLANKYIWGTANLGFMQKTTANSERV